MPSENHLPYLLIRADANTKIGIGHVMRCLALAQSWRSAGGRAEFIGHCENPAICARIESQGFGFTPLTNPYPDKSDPANTLKRLEFLAGTHSRNPWIVVDGYQFDGTYQKTLRSSGYPLMVIDDTAHLPHYFADILLNQNINADRLSYNINSDAVTLMGTRFVLLRPEFKAWKKWQRRIPDVARKVLITLGGSDPHNVTLKCINALRRIEKEQFEAMIVVGPYHPKLEQINRAVKRKRSYCDLVVNPTDMPDRMAWADVAISAGGSTNWELAFMGLPSLIIAMAENQRIICEGMDEIKAMVYAGSHEVVTEETIASRVLELCENRQRRTELREACKAVVDGNGVDRVTNTMSEMCCIRVP